jgi:hypothetical protein
MADPIIEKIAQDVLAIIQTATITNGYNANYTVERRNQRADAEKDNHVIIHQMYVDSLQDNAGDDVVGGRTYRQTFWLHTYVVESEGSSTPIDNRINIARSDIEKVMLSDPQFLDSARLTPSGTVIDTRIMPPETWDDPRYEGITVVVEVQYRTAYEDPFKER